MPQTPSEIDSIIQKTRPTNRDLVRRDVTQAFQLPIAHLTLKSSEYFYNDGSSRELLCLTGTVACNYRGSRYNIPVELWLQQDHPQVAPLTYVKPTSDMYISTMSQDVRPDGTVTLSYLRTWRHPSSDLSTLLQTMSDAFSQTPPVYSSPSTAATPYPSNPSLSMPTPNFGSNNVYRGASMHNAPYPVTYSSYPGSSNRSAIPQDIYRDSLQTALIEKIRDRFNEVTPVVRGQIDSLKNTERSLVEGDKQLDSFIEQLHKQQVQGESYLIKLQEKIDQLNEKQSQLSSMNRDAQSESSSLREDALLLPAPIYKQLFQSYAEEHAIQDLLFYLSEGLERRSISLDIYLKHVRELSRRQFLLRATMRKCRQIAGLKVN